MAFNIGLGILSVMLGLYNSTLGSVNMCCRQPTQHEKEIEDKFEKMIRDNRDTNEKIDIKVDTVVLLLEKLITSNSEKP